MRQDLPWGLSSRSAKCVDPRASCQELVPCAILCGMTDAKKPLDFESALSELEKLVGRMEQGELTLKDSLDEFERGVQLVGACEAALKEAELRVQVLLKGNDPSALKRFEP